MHRNSTILWFFLLAIVATGIILAAYVHNTTTKIQNALAEEVLQQQYDVANLMYGYAGVMLSLERLQLQPDGAKRSQVDSSLVNAQFQLREMRSNYSFQRLDGAAKAHAFVRPILGDVQQWLSMGIPGYDKNEPIVLAMAARRLSDRYPLLRAIAVETDQVATNLLSRQSEYLEQFRSSLLLLFAGFSLLTICISVLLVKQRNLQTRFARTQEQHASKFKDFADAGADLFWESDNLHNLTILSGETGSLPDSLTHRITAREIIDADMEELFNHQKACSPWPVELMESRASFYDVEADWMTPEGNSHVMSMSGKPVFDEESQFLGYRGVGRNITDRKRIEHDLQKANLLLVEAESRGRQQAERALQDSERFHRIILDALPLNIAILDTEGTIKAANTAWKSFLFSRSANTTETGIGVNFRDVYNSFSEIKQQGIETAIEHIDSVLRGNDKPLSEEYQYVSSGEDCWFAIATTSFDAFENRFTVLVHEDVTERIQLQERDRHLRAELAHVSRVNIAGELASGLAHELNQPLTSISHNCDTLLSIAQDLTHIDQEIYDISKDIYDQSHRAGEIIRSLRRLIRKDAGMKSAADINELVRETIRLTQAEAQAKGIKIILNLDEALPLAVIDKMQLQQVLVNLERNSVESMAGDEVAEKVLTISTTLRSDDKIMVSVQDTGPGFDSSVKERMFSAFLTTKKGGMGLGLSISRTIIESQGGLLWLDEACPDRTTIRFTIPVKRA